VGSSSIRAYGASVKSVNGGAGQLYREANTAAEAERAELLQLLRDEGILWATPAHAVLGRDGVPADWMLYTYPVTLTSRGGKLVAGALLPILRTFESRQLVSVGYTAIPIMSACILFSNGEFRGACIRENRKNYGSCRRIEGALDRRLPVIVVDDSISSGTSVQSAIAVLEEEHFEVEGAVALVRFPWRGGVERTRADGYRVETAFDIWTDVKMPMAAYSRGHDSVAAVWSSERVKSGLHPAIVARRTTTEILESGRTLSSPAALDKEYDGSGGVFISFRDRDTEYRVARDGFWHFDPADADASRDVVLATTKTVVSNREQIVRHGLERLKIAVSFFGAMRRVHLCDLDFENLGVVVRSLVQPGKVGGALPNTQVFTSEIEQYRHAAFRNAQLGTSEPHEVFVHSVTKFPEPGCYWLPYGHPPADAELPEGLGERLTARAYDSLETAYSSTAVEGVPLEDDMLPDPVYGLAVTLYDRGLIGCSVSWGSNLDNCLIRATKQAARDSRFHERYSGCSTERVSICVSILRDRELLGTNDVSRALVKARLGVDSVGVTDGRSHAIFLPQVPVHFDWTRIDLAKELIRKAHIDGTDAAWTTYRTDSWLCTKGQVHSLHFGFPKRDFAPTGTGQLRNTLQVLCQYIVGQVCTDGLPAYSYSPVTNRTHMGGTATRTLHAVTALIEAGILLDRAEFVAAAKGGIQFALDRAEGSSKKACVAIPEDTASLGADAELLLGLSALGGVAALDVRGLRLYEKLAATLRRDGRVDGCEKRHLGADHDFLPGLVLLAISSYASGRMDLPDFDPQLHWYQRRFELLKSWGMIGWHPQAWLRIWAAGQQSDALVDFVRQMVDWALVHQHRNTGAFLTDLSVTGPSFHTAFIMEGVADAATLLSAVGEEKVAQAYINSWLQGYQFVDRLIIREQDTFCMKDPDKALGGVRPTLASTAVRIDFVSHAVQAIIKGLRYLETH